MHAHTPINNQTSSVYLPWVYDALLDPAFGQSVGNIIASSLASDPKAQQDMEQRQQYNKKINTNIQRHTNGLIAEQDAATQQALKAETATTDSADNYASATVEAPKLNPLKQQKIKEANKETEVIRITGKRPADTQRISFVRVQPPVAITQTIKTPTPTPTKFIYKSPKRPLSPWSLLAYVGGLNSGEDEAIAAFKRVNAERDKQLSNATSWDDFEQLSPQEMEYLNYKNNGGTKDIGRYFAEGAEIGLGLGSNLKGKAINTLDPLTRNRVERYAELVNSDTPWKWNEIDSQISRTDRRLIKQYAQQVGLIPIIPVNPKTRYADFSSVLIRAETLPESLWQASDKVQFEYLDNLIGGRPFGTTWHHHQSSGRMELLPFGIHNVTNHYGGRTTWAIGNR